jgi:hypothetical protein
VKRETALSLSLSQLLPLPLPIPTWKLQARATSSSPSGISSSSPRRKYAGRGHVERPERCRICPIIVIEPFSPEEERGGGGRGNGALRGSCED